MTAAERIAAEILTGRRELLTEVLQELELAHGWREDDPPETEIMVRSIQRMKWEPYTDPKVRKRMGAEGRWMALDQNGKWQPAKLPRDKHWRPA